MNHEAKFKELYGRLNKKQKEAVDAIDGPIMVVAGPGTGKTEILTLRIANILRKTDTEPENILALTFTESGAVSMRRRLVEIVGSSGYSVVINTFHGFCNDAIQKYPEEFPHIIGSRNINEVEQVKILENLIASLPLKELRPFGDAFYYLGSALANINRLKREGISPDAFKKIVRDEKKKLSAVKDAYHTKGPHKGKIKAEHQKRLRKIAKNEELVKIYHSYQEKLSREKLYDYSDMIMEVMEALSKSTDFRRMLQEQHQYILVDEHQDTNNAQNKILEMLSEFHPNPNIFVVGDEKQAIFRFQGASLENFLYFKKIYSKVKLIVLEENYRSTQMILDSAGSIVPHALRLKTNVPHKNKKIYFYQFSHQDAERYFLAADVKGRLSARVPANEIAILYRDNNDAFPIARIFEKFKIPFVIESDQNILDDVEVKKLLLLLRAVSNFGDEGAVIRAMHIDFLKIDPLDIYKISARAKKERIFVYDIIKSYSVLQKLNLSLPGAVFEFYRNLSRWKHISKNNDAQHAFETVVRESGFLQHILSLADSAEKIDKLTGLFDEVKSLLEPHQGVELEDFFLYLDMLSKHNILIGRVAVRHTIPRVRLMTAHRAKGLEFDHVYIAGAFDGHWGNRRHPERLPLPPKVFSLLDKDLEADENDDERRLFYVALTRARKTVTISYSKINSEGKEQLPSQFISEMRADFVSVENTAALEREFNKKNKILFAPSAISGIGVKNKKFVTELFQEQGLSVTALNNYLECPWKYFYLNLLRIPRVKTKHEMYGTAVHNALRDFFETLKARPVSRKFLLDKFIFYLNREALSENDFLEILEKGKKSLGGYYDSYSKSFKRNALVEFDIRGVMLGDDIRLTGKIDKIEFVGEGGGAVNVVDYKTGRPRSKGEIEGKTKNSLGNIKRQLVFYKLLLDAYKEGKYKMVSGEIDFVEPDEKERYHRELFEIDDSEVRELSGIIKKTADEILRLSFWNKTCGDEKCGFCGLRKMVNPKNV